MANNSTDELCNAHHHLVEALRLEFSDPQGPVTDIEHLLDMEQQLSEMLEQRTGTHLQPASRFRRLFPTRPR